jgi:membrane-associated phospholipid phosphatase
MDQVAAVRNTPRGQAAFATNYKAFYWQSPEGLNTWVYRYMDKWMAEDRLDKNPPRAARAYALVSAVQFDAFIANQESKFSYWYIRPSQLDPTIVPLFPNPNHPSYPSNHAAFSTARSEILAYLFPTRAGAARALGQESGQSRLYAGIHYPMDIAAGSTLGRSVAGLFIDWGNSDGSQ